MSINHEPNLEYDEERVITDETPFLDMRRGQPTLHYHFSEACTLPQALVEFAHELVEGESVEENYVQVELKIADLLIPLEDYVIEGHEGLVLFDEDKPLIDALKQDLETLLARLNGVVYLPTPPKEDK